MKSRIPAGHLLGHPAATGGAYTARCGCGTDVWGKTLWQMWASHQEHLTQVRWVSKRRHPSQGGGL